MAEGRLDSLSKARHTRLNLHETGQRNVLRTWESERVRPSRWLQAWRWLISSPIRLAGAGAALMGAMILLVVLRPHDRAAAGNSASQTVAEVGQNAWVIDVPFETQNHLFRQENGTVIDAISQSAAVGRARF